MRIVIENMVLLLICFSVLCCDSSLSNSSGKNAQNQTDNTRKDDGNPSDINNGNNNENSPPSIPNPIPNPGNAGSNTQVGEPSIPNPPNNGDNNTQADEQKRKTFEYNLRGLSVVDTEKFVKSLLNDPQRTEELDAALNWVDDKTGNTILHRLGESSGSDDTVIKILDKKPALADVENKDGKTLFSICVMRTYGTQFNNKLIDALVKARPIPIDSHLKVKNAPASFLFVILDSIYTVHMQGKEDEKNKAANKNTLTLIIQKNPTQLDAGTIGEINLKPGLVTPELFGALVSNKGVPAVAVAQEKILAHLDLRIIKAIVETMSAFNTVPVIQLGDALVNKADIDVYVKLHEAGKQAALTKQITDNEKIYSSYLKITKKSNDITEEDIKPFVSNIEKPNGISKLHDYMHHAYAINELAKFIAANKGKKKTAAGIELISILDRDLKNIIQIWINKTLAD